MQGRTDFDLVGIGFGPSNLALGVRLAEAGVNAAHTHCFIERQPSFGWHKGMLLDDCRMQISFLKDLVTLRDPTSRFSFLNYLFEHGRLAEFINVKSFYPTRHEFHDYLNWAAQKIAAQVNYGETVTAVLPVFSQHRPKRERKQVVALEIVSHDAAGRMRRRVTRALSLGLGGVNNVPYLFEALGSAHVLHSAHYLTRIDQLLGERTSPRKTMRVAVIGSGQSAAEIFVDLTRRFTQVEASLIMRSPALKPADDSPFVNEIFDPAFTDVMYAQSPEKRQAMIARYQDTNYAVVDKPLIDVIYDILYQQKVTRYAPHRVLANADIKAASITQSERISLSIQDNFHGHQYAEIFDVIVLATGYRHDAHIDLLQPLASHLGHRFLDGFAERDYRLPVPEDFLPRIYLQGACEQSHGLSDTLLSVLAIRADEIASSLEGMSTSKLMSACVPEADAA